MKAGEDSVGDDVVTQPHRSPPWVSGCSCSTDLKVDLWWSSGHCGSCAPFKPARNLMKGGEPDGCRSWGAKMEPRQATTRLADALEEVNGPLSVTWRNRGWEPGWALIYRSVHSGLA